MERTKVFSILFVITFCTLASGPSTIDASPAKLSPLRHALRRAVRDVTMNGRVEAAACNDNSQCASNPTVCAEDPDLAVALCPAMCGACICEDNAIAQGNCTALKPSVCQDDFTSTLCAKTCGLCGKAPVTCMDHVTGIKCSDLNDPCSDAFGQMACPKFCGLCSDTTTTATTTTSKPVTDSTTDVCSTKPCLNNGICSLASNSFGFVCQCPTLYSGEICQIKEDVCSTKPCLNNGVCSLASNSFGFVCQCPTLYSGAICQIKEETTTIPPNVTAPSCANALTDKTEIPCQESEVVFLIEYSRKDSTLSIDHEGDYIKYLVSGWRIDTFGIRFGVVVYHDTVTEAIHITDFENDPRGLQSRISSITRRLRPSGEADLGKALDYVRTISFKDARPGAVKVVIPIIHEMPVSVKDKIVPAANRLKDDCVNIAAKVINFSGIDYDVIHQTVSQPYADFSTYYTSFRELENAGVDVYHNPPTCQSTS